MSRHTLSNEHFSMAVGTDHAVGLFVQVFRMENGEEADEPIFEADNLGVVLLLGAVPELEDVAMKLLERKAVEQQAFAITQADLIAIGLALDLKPDELTVRTIG